MSNSNPRPNVRMTHDEYHQKLVEMGAPEDVLNAWNMGDPGNRNYVFDWVFNHCHKLSMK